MGEQLKEITAKLKDNKEVTKEDVDGLTFPENLPDDAMMVPVDMRGVEEEFDDVEQMVEKLGPKGAAEAFIKAREYFKKNEDKVEEAERAQPMTAKEWREVLEQEDDGAFGEGGEEEMPFLEGEEEEFFGEEGEEEIDEGEGEDDGEAEEPAAKKAKTD